MAPICAVEWADQLFEEDLGDHLRFEFRAIEEDRRKIEITAHGENAQRILKELKELEWD